MMPPGAAPAGLALSLVRTARVAKRGDAVEVCGVPVETPLMDDRRDVVEAVAVRRALADAPGRVPAGRHFVRRKRGSPRRRRILEAAARRALPLRLRGQPPSAADDLGQPVRVGHGIEPGHPDDRLIGVGEGEVLPPGRRRGRSRGEERLVLRARDRRPPERERGQFDVVDRRLVRAPAGCTHAEPPSGNGHQRGAQHLGWRGDGGPRPAPGIRLRAGVGRVLSHVGKSVRTIALAHSHPRSLRLS